MPFRIEVQGMKHYYSDKTRFISTPLSSLYYRIIDDQVIVVACMHGRRHPRRWQSRS